MTHKDQSNYSFMDALKDIHGSKQFKDHKVNRHIVMNIFIPVTIWYKALKYHLIVFYWVIRCALETSSSGTSKEARYADKNAYRGNRTVQVEVVERGSLKHMFMNSW